MGPGCDWRAVNSHRGTRSGLQTWTGDIGSHQGAVQWEVTRPCLGNCVLG